MSAEKVMDLYNKSENIAVDKEYIDKIQLAIQLEGHVNKLINISKKYTEL